MRSKFHRAVAVVVASTASLVFAQTANDARMNQVVFAQGHLWSGINTLVNPGPRDGIEYFIVNLPNAFEVGVISRFAEEVFPRLGLGSTGTPA